MTATSIPSLKTAVRNKIAEFSLKASPATISDIVRICEKILREGGPDTIESALSRYLTFTQLQQYDVGIDPQFRKPPAEPEPRRKRGRPAKSTKHPFAKSKPAAKSKSTRIRF